MSSSAVSARLYVTQPLTENAIIMLDKPQAHYLASVLRQKTGNHIALFNGVDGEWRGAIESLERKSATIRLETLLRPQKNEPDIWLCFAPIKFGRIDFLVQKATELGASALTPVRTERTIVSRLNPERLEANMVEASEQCERLTIPTLHDYTDFEHFLAEWPKERTLIYADESGTGASAAQVMHDFFAADTPPLAMLIGPEGGFTHKEHSLLQSRPFTTAMSLGPRILRADTAALAALTCAMAAHPDWQNGRPHFVE